MKQNFALLGIEPTLEKKGRTFPSLYDLNASKKVAWGYEQAEGARQKTDIGH